jgi:hypothetical protein
MFVFTYPNIRLRYRNVRGHSIHHKAVASGGRHAIIGLLTDADASILSGKVLGRFRLPEIHLSKASL